MSRAYTLGKRAERQAETRRRIVEAAVDLHGTLGPARTSLSMVAERAGVQRNTFYAHFPDERSLAMACSGLAFERNPPPDASAWTGLAPGGERLRAGLAAIYGWYGGQSELLGCVMRDAEVHAITREVSDLRFGPVVAGWHAVLGEGLSGVQPAMLHLGLSFQGWRALEQEAGLTRAAAVEAMTRAILAA
jgi:AcrR family transcriptional regulator